MPLAALCLMMSCIQVFPDSSQFFRYDSFNLSCTERQNSTGWKVRRSTADGGDRPCTSGWGIGAPDSTCQVRNTYPSDTGVYWCESDDGNRSNVVNITIIDRTVLLGSPAVPVPAGSSVTLRCKADTYDPKHTYVFRKDGRRLGSSHSGVFTFHGASPADRGLYTCHIPGFGDSMGSWLTVDGSAPPTAASSSPPVSRLMCHLVVGTPYLLSTVLLGLIYRDRIRAARTVAERRGGEDDVVMELVV